MCFDPVSAGVALSALTAAAAEAAPAIAIASGVTAAGGALYAGHAAKKEGEFNAAVATENAKAERAKGAAEAEALDARYDRLRASQKSAAAASGVDPNSGSASLIINQDTSKSAYLDTMSAMWNANSSATAFESEAIGAKMRGKNAQTASYFNAGSSFLNGLGQAGSLRSRTKAA